MFLSSVQYHGHHLIQKSSRCLKRPRLQMKLLNRIFIYTSNQVLPSVGLLQWYTTTSAGSHTLFLQDINVANNQYIDRNMDESCCANDKCKTHCNQMTLCLLYFQFSGVDQRDSPPFWGVTRYKQPSPIRNLTTDAMFYYYILNDIENNWFSFFRRKKHYTSVMTWK